MADVPNQWLRDERIHRFVGRARRFMFPAAFLALLLLFAYRESTRNYSRLTPREAAQQAAERIATAELRGESDSFLGVNNQDYRVDVTREANGWHVTFTAVPGYAGGHTTYVVSDDGKIIDVWPGL